MTFSVLFELSLPKSAAFAQIPADRTIINRPAVSGRCQTLLDQRRQKIKNRQKLRALLRRNEKLLDKVPKSKDTIRAKLEFTHTKIENNIRFSKLQLQRMEEDIVRRGCPGVLL